MTARILDGKALAASMRADVKRSVERLSSRGVRPGLAVVLAGEDPASRVYVRNKVRACEETGVRSLMFEYPASVSEAELLERIASLNADRTVHGILVQTGFTRPISARSSPARPASSPARPPA
jgi:methylenetetrahydrofolate dehydrogenase (NADP+)/methenyltetrahydrofolate cyclohydrolase